MIHSTHRFHGRSSLRFVFQKGKQIRSEYMSVRVVRNTRQHTWRAAVVVSRKVSKSAVVRNRIRRRIFEIIRKNAGRIDGPYDIVVTVYTTTAADTDHMSLSKSILDILQHAGVLKESVNTQENTLG